MPRDDAPFIWVTTGSRAVGPSIDEHVDVSSPAGIISILSWSSGVGIRAHVCGERARADLDGWSRLDWGEWLIGGVALHPYVMAKATRVVLVCDLHHDSTEALTTIRIDNGSAR